MIKEKKIKSMRRLWDALNKKDKLGFISFLEKGAKWADEEFHWTGIRFVDRMTERFREYGKVEFYYADILEIGCGIGRFMKPLACIFKTVYGVDISKKMLKTAKKYCAGMPNITTHLNDGFSLDFLEDNTFDYCVSAGVFQHITHIDVITGYIREAIRVLKPGGLFLFQFEANRTRRIGHGTLGARITAGDLDRGLRGEPFTIREVSSDPKDPIRNMVIVIEKTDPLHSSADIAREFKTFKMIERRWLIGVYDDVTTRTSMHKRLERTPYPLTFYDNDADILDRLTADGVDKVGIWGAGLTCEFLLERLSDTSIRVDAIYDSTKTGTFKGYRLKNPSEVEIPVEIPVIIASSRPIEALSPVVEQLRSRGITYYHFK